MINKTKNNLCLFCQSPLEEVSIDNFCSGKCKAYYKLPSSKTCDNFYQLTPEKQLFFHSEHKRLWNWLANNPSRRIADYFACFPKKYIPMNACYACEATLYKEKDVQTEYVVCHKCPLQWTKNNQNCRNLKSLFFQYVEIYTENPTEEILTKRSKLAYKIKNLPINPNYKGLII